MWANLDSSKTPLDFSITQLGETAGVVPEKIARGSCWVTGWEVEGKFNWKVAAQQTENPSPPKSGRVESLLALLKSQILRILTFRYRNHVSLFPPVTMQKTTPTPFWYTVSIFPLSPEKSMLRCDVYSARYADAGAFEGEVKQSLDKEIEGVRGRLEEQWKAAAEGDGGGKGVVPGLASKCATN